MKFFSTDEKGQVGLLMRDKSVSIDKFTFTDVDMIILFVSNEGKEQRSLERQIVELAKNMNVNILVMGILHNSSLSLCAMSSTVATFWENSLEYTKDRHGVARKIEL